MCPFKLLTGWDCPACGGLRAVNDLAHGHIGAAFHSNAVFVASVPLLVLAWVWWLRREWAGTPRRRMSAGVRRVVQVLVVALLAAFTVWRNTPWGSAFHVA